MDRVELEKWGREALEDAERSVAAGEDASDILRRLEKDRGPEAAAGLLLVLFDVALPPARAREVLKRAEALRRRIERDAGTALDFRTALFQVLVIEEGRVRSPRVVERAAYREILQSSITDGLTGLYNQRHFRESFYREIKRSRRYRLHVSLLFLDLDNFKEYNDSCGHPAGDEALRAIAAILRSSCREIDTVCRYGGEEFAVLLPATGKGGARVLGEKLRRLVEEHPFAGESKTPAGRLTVSGGISTYPEDGMSVDELLENADRALYQAKNFTKNAVCYYFRQEKRAFPRIEKEYRLIWRPRKRGATGTDTRTRDISRGGLSFTTREPLPLSTEVHLELRSDVDAPAVSLTGRVVRIEREERQGVYHIGIKFEPEPGEDLLRLLDR